MLRMTMGVNRYIIPKHLVDVYHTPLPLSRGDLIKSKHFSYYSAKINYFLGNDKLLAYFCNYI
jgi:hypothetical protein